MSSINSLVKASKQQLLNIFKATAAVNNEARVDLTVEALNVRTMGPEHIDMIDINYTPDKFETYEVPTAISFGARIAEVVKALNRMSKNESVTLGLTDDSMLELRSGDLGYRLKLIEASKGSQSLPKLTLPTKITMPRARFMDALADMAIIDDTVALESKDGKVRLSAKGDLGESEKVISPEDGDGITITSKDEASASFVIERLLGILQAVNTDNVIVEFGGKMPIRLTLESVTYFLGPRIKD